MPSDDIGNAYGNYKCRKSGDNVPLLRGNDAGNDRLRDSCADERSNRRRIQICILFDRRGLFGTDRVLLHLPVE